MTESPEEPIQEHPGRFQKLSGTALIVITLVVAFTLVNSAYRAYAEGLRAIGEREKLDPRIEAMEMRLERETSRAINRLDPDYRRAEYERDRGILAPGEELLPIYGGE